MSTIEHIKTALKRLSFLGYHRFQVKQIIEEAIGQHIWEKDNHDQNIQILIKLEEYEKLGTDYLLTYSK